MPPRSLDLAADFTVACDHRVLPQSMGKLNGRILQLLAVRQTWDVALRGTSDRQTSWSEEAAVVYSIIGRLRKHPHDHITRYPLVPCTQDD